MNMIPALPGWYRVEVIAEESGDSVRLTLLDHPIVAWREVHGSEMPVPVTCTHLDYSSNWAGEWRVPMVLKRPDGAYIVDDRAGYKLDEALAELRDGWHRFRQMEEHNEQRQRERWERERDAQLQPQQATAEALR